MQDYGLAVAAIAMTAVALYLARRAHAQSALPSYLPFSMLEIIRHFSDPHTPVWVLQQVRLFGPVFRVRFPSMRPSVVVSDPRIARTILSNPRTRKSEFYSSLLGLTGGNDSIFSLLEVDAGSRWHQRRKGVVPAFAPSQVSSMNEQCAMCFARWATDVLEPAIAEGRPVDMCKEMLRTTVQFICAAAFNYAASPAECDLLLIDLATTSRVVTKIYAMVPFAERVSWAFADGRECGRATRRMHALAQLMLDNYRALGAADKVAHSSMIIARIIENEAYTSDQERIADVLVMLIAGHDTTALSLSWALYDLASHPDEQARLRAELRAAAEPSKAAGLAAAIKESMRLNPPSAGGVARVAPADVPVGDGTVIAAGSQVFLHVYSIQRDASVFVQPDAYVPSRWLKHAPSADAAEQGASAAAHEAMEHAFMPFLVGRRSCVGQALAQAELYTVLPKLLLGYEWTVATPPVGTQTLTWKPEGLRLRAVHAAPAPA
jgi:cytochrome P450